jgi:hypothetical protein
MKDVTSEIRTEQHRTALKQYAVEFKKLGDYYITRALHATDAAKADRADAMAEGIYLCADALASAAEWDTPDRPERSLGIRDGRLTDDMERFLGSPSPLPLPGGSP